MPRAALWGAAGGAAAFELLRNCESILLAETAGESVEAPTFPFEKQTNKKNLCICCFKVMGSLCHFHSFFVHSLVFPCCSFFCAPFPASYWPPSALPTYVKSHIFCHLLFLLKVSLSTTIVQFPALQYTPHTHAHVCVHVRMHTHVYILKSRVHMRENT